MFCTFVFRKHIFYFKRQTHKMDKHTQTICRILGGWRLLARINLLHDIVLFITSLKTENLRFFKINKTCQETNCMK